MKLCYTWMDLCKNHQYQLQGAIRKEFLFGEDILKEKNL